MNKGIIFIFIFYKSNSLTKPQNKNLNFLKGSAEKKERYKDLKKTKIKKNKKTQRLFIQM